MASSTIRKEVCKHRCLFGGIDFFGVVIRRVSDLDVSVYKVIDLKVLVVVTPRIEQRLRDLDPAQVPDQFEERKPGKVDDRGVVGVDPWKGRHGEI